ncbi:UGMP family protein [Candidatus Micrarchaeota archaeon]|nr:UGMP family protein [Candidatus Micrarchaeota archaeon]
MRILGFEATAHTFGASLVEGNPDHPFSSHTRVLSNVNAKYPAKPEGFIPRQLADHHVKHYARILKESFASAGMRPSDVDMVAYSYGPGLGHSLHIGFMAARSFSVVQHVPFLGVNHALAHVEVGRLFCKQDSPLAVYVSGGNTQLLSLEPRGSERRYAILGETLDIGLGNFLDLVGRHLRLSPPDAVGVLKAAPKGQLIPLPYAVKGMNVSFTGLLTTVKRLPSTTPPADICFSSQEVAFSMLCEAVEKSLVLSRKKEVLLVGGNARNKRLQEMVRLVGKEHRVKFGVPSFEFCGDNAGMIALTGLMQARHEYGKNRVPDQKVRVDQERVLW